MKPKVRIRRANPADMPAVHGLVRELAQYERAPEQVETDAQRFAADGYGDRPYFECLVAETEAGKIVGAAVYYFGYSTWKGKMLYLDDLIVTQSARRGGIGKLLFDALVARARAEEAAQLRWHVLDWNEPAIAFYKKIQAELDPSWVTGILQRDALERWR